MNQIASLICVLAIMGLFYLDRDAGARTMKAVWIPVLWFLIGGSRPVSVWLNIGSSVSQAQQYLEGSPLDAAVFGILIVGSVLILNRRADQVRGILRRNTPMILFFAYCAISILWSDFPFVALKRWTKAIGDVAMILVILTDSNPLMATKRYFSRATFLLLPLSVLLITFYPDLGTSLDGHVVMYNGVAETKNSLGMICIVCGLGSLWSFMGAYEDREMEHRERHLIAHGAMLATAAVLVLIANSITSLSCLVLGGTVMVLSGQRLKGYRIINVHALISGALALPLFAIFVDTMGTLLSSLGRNSTLTGRTAIWSAVLSMHTNVLFGTGFESFWLGSRLQSVWGLTGYGLQEAHNGYIELYLNLGWVGLLLLGYMTMIGYRRAIAVLSYDPHAGRLRLALITAALVYSLTEAGFRIMNPIWVPFLMAITVVPLDVSQEERARSKALPSIWVASRRTARILQ
jgi:O-antigen ligase